MELKVTKVNAPKELDLNNVIKQDSAEGDFCRICFDPESESNLLINPCKCIGSMKFVHEECLKIWILSSNRDMESSCCDVCKAQFTMKVVLKRVCSCANLKEETCKLLVFPLIIILISTVFVIVVIYLAQGIREDTLAAQEKVYFSLVIFACCLIIGALCFILGKTVLNACSVLKIKEWSIKNIKSDNSRLDETFDITRNTEISNREVINARRYNTELVIQGTARFRGRNVVVPEIGPTNLIRDQESGIVYFSRHNTSRSRSVPLTARNNERNTDEAAEPLSTNRHNK